MRQGLRLFEPGAVFELGSSLREARVRRELTLGDVAEETRIRSRYLQALEDERFELLPGPIYAKGFLRAYADYLGLDSQLFVDEYNARFAEEEPLPAPRQLELRTRPRRREVVAAAVLVVVGAGAVLAPLVLHATNGPCWLAVRRRDEHGRLLFEGTLQQGDWRRFPGGRLWIRIGAPWNLQAFRAQRQLSLPSELATVSVSARGVRTLPNG